MSNASGGTVVGVLEQVLHHHLVQAQRGLLPPVVQASVYKRVLHLNCRTGAWAIDLSLSYPDVDVVALDSMPQLIEIARLHASAGEIRRAHFAAHQPNLVLPFADQSFDLLHCSLFLPVFRPHEWAVALRDYWRVLRPGGTISFACMSLGPSSSHAYQRVLQLLDHFFRDQGYAFCEHGSALFHGPYLCPLLRTVGFERIVYTLHPIDFGGWNNAAGRACCQLFLSEVQKSRQVFLDCNLISGPEFDAIVAQKQKDLSDSLFYASGTLFSIIAVKTHDAQEKEQTDGA